MSLMVVVLNNLEVIKAYYLLTRPFRGLYLFGWSGFDWTITQIGPIPLSLLGGLLPRDY